MSDASANGKVRLIIAALVVIGVAVAIGSALSGPDEPPIQLVNGFEFPVTVEVTDAGGDTVALQVPAKGRVGADFAGEHTLVFKTADGTEMGKKAYAFDESGDREAGCVEFVNVLGSAAIVEEDVVYGFGIKGAGKMTSGVAYVKLCPTWGFETAAPPEAISTEKSSIGRTLSWMHYIGDGDWHAAIDSLLSLEPDIGDQNRIRAFNLAVAVSKFDPQNPRFAALGPRFVQACHSQIDMFEGGPLAGQGRAKCLRNTQALFPGT